MENYANQSGRSGIRAYQIGVDYIIVQFNSGHHTLYTYTYNSAGGAVIETMKELARSGVGLNSYISINNPDYTSRS